ncbi:MAG: hypothetical protein IJG85_04110 [Eubacteriaceae bacterium]|nr:hypothetical protein [Eubacteriaceae bacterium]
MLINIKMMTDEAYATLQKNYKDVYKQIRNHPSDSTWLEGFLGFNPYKTKKYFIKDFELKDSENYSEVAFENGVILYETIKDLPRYIICNSKFWAWITFEKAYKQAQQAMNLVRPDLVKNFWLTSNSRRSLMLGVVSRSYFRTEISVDDSHDGDKYILTKRLVDGFRGLEMYRALVYRNIGMLKPVSLAFIQCITDANIKYGDTILRQEQLRETMKDASRIGSVMLIDDMDKEEIYDIIFKKLEKRLNDNSLAEELKNP